MRHLIAVLSILLLAAPAAADPKPPEPVKPTVIKVVREPFKATVSLNGVFMPTVCREQVIRPKSWSEFIVVKAVPHGTVVPAGRELVRFDREKLDTQLAELANTVKLEELDAAAATAELEHLRKSTALSLQTAERACSIVAEDLQRFKKIFRPSHERWTKRAVKDLENFLAYEQEELKQLEQMYKEDEVTEETEEIILRRQRDWVAKVKFFLSEAKITSGERLSVELPRLQKTLEQELAKARLDLEKIKIDLPAKLKKKKIEVQKQLLKRKQTKLRHEKLEADLTQMTITAPQAGTVYYGKFRDGKWDPVEADRVLRPGGRARPHQVLLSVVHIRPLTVAVIIPEASLELIEPGMPAKVVPNPEPQQKLNAVIKTVSTVPVAPGNFAGTLTIDVPDQLKRVVPGVGCKAQLTTYVNPKALTLAKKSVFTDELDDTRHYVWRWDDKTKRARRHYIRTGRSSSDKIEVLSGLEAGDEVLKTKPKDNQ